jgi:16S rRNA (adenine1518-N6/adenine1519-N6)-dimethyltransferase
LLVIRKRFGQHFLEPAWVDKVIRAIDPKPDELFIEIGPGRGALTRPLAARAKAVTGYEIDRDLAADLRASAIPHLTVVEGDFLELAPNIERRTSNVEPSTSNAERRTPNVGVRVAGNLPYNVASPILFKLVELCALGVPLVDATVMLQREVADRLVAPPGGKEYGVLSVLIQHAAHVEMVLKLPPGAFRPAPKVHSALVRLRFHPADPPVADRAVFQAMVQAVFTRRRKTIANALLAFKKGDRTSIPTPAEALAAAELDGSGRPETLSIAEFARLANAYSGTRRAVL